MSGSLDGEVLRVRDNVHAMAASVTQLEWRVKDIERRLGLLEPDVAALAEADRIAAAVAHRMGRDRQLVLSTGARLFGGMIGGLTAADLVLRIISHH